VKGLALEMALSYRRLAARLAKKMKDGAQAVGFWLLQPSMGATRTEAARIGGVSCFISCNQSAPEGGFGA
jgi:hypothetical protein